MDTYFRYSGAANTTVTTTRVSAYYCPSDGNNQQTVATKAPFITSQNYVANFGNITEEQGVVAGTTFTPSLTYNGVTYPFLGAPFTDIGAPDPYNGSGQDGDAPTVPFSAITDGLSNTMLLSECVVGVTSTKDDLRGYSWWSYAASFSGFLTPNSTNPDWFQSASYCNYPYQQNPPCDLGQNGMDMLAARSRHPGGVNVTFIDGSVKFITNNVNPTVYMALSSTRGARSSAPTPFEVCDTVLGACRHDGGVQWEQPRALASTTASCSGVAELAVPSGHSRGFAVIIHDRSR